MRSLFVFHKNKKYSTRFDFYSYVTYRYQRIFWRSLIFRGRKLWAFKFFVNLKYELKIRENLDPLLIFVVAMMKITPVVLLYKIRLGGAFHGVPFPAGERKRYTFATSGLLNCLKILNVVLLWLVSLML